MVEQIREQLAPLCRRERRLAMLSRVAQGLSVGAATALVVGLAGMALAWASAPVIGYILLGIGLAAGVAAAARVRIDWAAAARAVDRHFGLADRTLTALSSAAAMPQRPVHQLQVRDTLARLKPLNPLEAACHDFPRKKVLIAAGTTLLAVMVLLAAGHQAGSATDEPRIDESVFQREFAAVPNISGTLAEQNLPQVVPLQRRIEQDGPPAHRLDKNAQIRMFFQTAEDNR